MQPFAERLRHILLRSVGVGVLVVLGMIAFVDWGTRSIAYKWQGGPFVAPDLPPLAIAFAMVLSGGAILATAAPFAVTRIARWSVGALSGVPLASALVWATFFEQPVVSEAQALGFAIVIIGLGIVIADAVLAPSARSG